MSKVPKTIQVHHEKYYKVIVKQHENDENDNRSRVGGVQKVYYENKVTGKDSKNPNPMFEAYGEMKTEKVEEEEKKREYNSDNKIKLDFSVYRSKITAKNILKDSKMSKSEVY